MNSRNIAKILVGLLFIFFGTFPLIFDFSQTEKDALLSFGALHITHNSLSYFLFITLRCVNSFALLSILISICPIYIICHKLRYWRVPGALVDIIELTFRYINIMDDTARHIAIAQVVRGGYNGWGSKIRDLGLLFSRTLLISISEADQVYNGSLTRLADNNNYELMTDTENKKIISLKNISYSYEKEENVLKNINIDLYEGEKVAVLGANGAGKSTLFSIISGIEKRTSGEYFFRDIHIGNNAEWMRKIRKKVSLVMQNSNYQLFTASVEDEIAYSLKNMGLSGSELEAKVDSILSYFDLQSLRTKTPYNLSEGQKKWVAIASILAIDPEVIILDEPTSNLDVPTSKKVVDLSNDLNKQGKTILLSTHDMNLASKWSTRSIVINKGEIVFDGKTSELFAIEQDVLCSWGICTPYI